MRAVFKSIVVVVLMLTVIGCKKEPKNEGYTLTGNVIGAEDGLVTMSLYDPITRTSKTIDSTNMVDGKFELKGSIEHPDQVQVLFNKQGGLGLFLENSMIHIEADLKNKDEYGRLSAEVTGSKLQDNLDAFNKKIDAIRLDEKYAELNKINKAYSEAGRNRDIDLQKELYIKRESLSHLSEDMQDRIKKEQLEFIKTNGASPIAPSIIGYSFGEMVFSFEELTSIFNSFKGGATNTLMYKYFEKKYNEIKRLRPGAEAPDFTLKTPEGEALSLSDIKDTYVLLDFWASWCKPCRASYPHLKKVYKKYKDAGFEVLAISTDSNHDKWKQAIEEDQTVWKHVVDTFSRPNFPSDIGTLYAIPFLPTTYLLDKEGKIIAKNLHADELDKKLEDIFGF